MDEYLQTALDAADAAATIHRERLGSVNVDGADEKGRMDFVTQVDLDAQRVALSIIRERFPEHQILAEEEDATDLGQVPLEHLDRGVPTWVVDPLDGTRNFLTRHPMHCASVGLVVDGDPVVGAVVSAPLGARWWAARGQGAFRNGEPISASAGPSLERGLIGTGFPFKAIDRLDEYLATLGRVLQRSAGVRRDGAAAIDLCHVAEGVLSGFWELTLAPWDIAGGLAIMHEAGAALGRIEDEPLDVLVHGSVAAARSAEELAVLRDWVNGSPG